VYKERRNYCAGGDISGKESGNTEVVRDRDGAIKRQQMIFPNVTPKFF
jgi:hypothetical protein